MSVNRFKSAPKDSYKTFTAYRSVIAADLGLTVANIVASVHSGSAVAVNAQTFDTNKLTYQIQFSEVGTAIVRLTTTFASSDETHIEDIQFQTLDHTLAMTDYC